MKTRWGCPRHPKKAAFPGHMRGCLIWASSEPHLSLGSSRIDTSWTASDSGDAQRRRGGDAHGATRRHTAPHEAHSATQSHTAPHSATQSHAEPHRATQSHTEPHAVWRRQRRGWLAAGDARVNVGRDEQSSRLLQSLFDYIHRHFITVADSSYSRVNRLRDRLHWGDFNTTGQQEKYSLSTRCVTWFREASTSSVKSTPCTRVIPVWLSVEAAGCEQ